MEKVIRDGFVAILYSPNYGAGWYSWHGCAPLLFHPVLVDLVEQGRQSEITQSLCKSLEPSLKGYIGDTTGLSIKWIPEGTRFIINEYDGAETIFILEGIVYIQA